METMIFLDLIETIYYSDINETSEDIRKTTLNTELLTSVINDKK